MEYIIECNFCGEDFTAKKSNAKFCSGNCRTQNHYAEKKEKKVIEVLDTEKVVYDQKQIFFLKSQLSEAERKANYFHQKIEENRYWVGRVSGRINKLKLALKTHEFQIEESTALIKRLLLKNKTNQGKIKQNNAEMSGATIASIESVLNRFEENTSLKVQAYKNEKKVNELPDQIAQLKLLLIKINHELGLRKAHLEDLTKEKAECRTQYQEMVKKIEQLKLQLSKPKKNSRVTVPHRKAVQSRRVIVEKNNGTAEIGAGDLQDMNFDTFTLNSELGRFLGELDFNRTCFALTGDSGAGKTYFSFELANLFITSLDIKAKYFSLEEGIGELTKEKVAHYNLGNELSLVAKGNLEDVRIAAKTFPLIIVDSFNKLNAKAADFENLRTDFPKTLFLLIFQKTTSGTMRGGSSIKYDSSATIDVIKRDGERIALMDKGRYGTIGWEYSIDEGRVIKEY